MIKRLIVTLMLAFLLPLDSLAESNTAQDPFADLERQPITREPVTPAGSGEPWWSRDLLFRKEVLLQVTASDRKSPASEDRLYSRQSIGFELQKRLNTRVSTLGSCDVQARLVRRDKFLPVVNDMEGEKREGWFFEYHNMYCDVLNPISFFADSTTSSALLGALNVRVGRFYLPFGLNLQTDTHGTVMQLSNDESFGFERDWYAGFWGDLGRNLKYDLYYLLGSGYDPSFSGQRGMLGLRLGSGSAVQNEFGIEAGAAILVGERLNRMEHREPVMNGGGDDEKIETLRYGPDLRWTIPTGAGNVIITNELSGGKDEDRDVFTELHQLGYLTRSRRFGSNVQFRHFWRDPPDAGERSAADSFFYEITYYLANDVASSTLHWVTANVEQQLRTPDRNEQVLVTLQYYRYW